MGYAETFIVDTDYEEGGYEDITTIAITSTTRTSSTATTTSGSGITAFTTSKNTDNKISFYSTTTTRDVTTLTTATATFETFGTSSVSTVLTSYQQSSEFVYAAPDEVLWIASATGFNAQAVLTAVGTTATSHSRRLESWTKINATYLSSGADITWPASTQGTLSQTGSYSVTTWGTTATTIIRTLTNTTISNFSNRLPHLTNTKTTLTYTTTSSSYVQSSFSLVAPGFNARASEIATSSVTFLSRYPVRRAESGLEYEELRTLAVSTSFLYTRAIFGYQRINSNESAAREFLIYNPATAWFYTTLAESFNNVHVLNRRTGGFMTYTDELSGWLTGLTVGSDSSVATTITFAQHRRGRYVPLPGSFAKYTVSKDSFTYTRSTSTNSTTASTTSSTLLDLAGQSRLLEEGVRVASLSSQSPFLRGFFTGQTIGGGVPSGETNFANVVGPAKINNSTVSTFNGSLSSTTNTSATASFVNALATMYAVTATGTANDIVTQRNITSMV
jgi:hypothetical protein